MTQSLFSWTPLALFAVLACGRTNFESRGSVDAASDAAVAVDASDDRPNIAFITSTYYSGDLGGIDGANAKCNDQALAAGLDGTFIAYLQSSLQIDPTAGLKNSRGWVSVKGEWIAETRQQIAAAELRNVLNRTEFGDSFNSPTDALFTWSGVGGANCTDWRDQQPTSTGGVRRMAGWGGLSGGFGTDPKACDVPHRLACFETGHRADRVAPVRNNRIIFVSGGSWNAQPTGRASADAFCASEAMSAGLAGAFVALLPIGSEPALTRITRGTADEFQRPDGELIGRLNAPTSFIHLDPTNQPVDGFIWTGSKFSSISTQHCGSWMDSSATGPVAASGFFGIESYDTGLRPPCSDPYHLYCVQQ
jgi:hypothetical protein